MSCSELCRHLGTKSLIVSIGMMPGVASARVDGKLEPGGNLAELGLVHGATVVLMATG